MRDETRLLREVAFLALHLHWSPGDLLDLPHGDREFFVEEVGRLTDPEAAVADGW